MIKEPKIKPSDAEKLTLRRRGGQRLTREEVKKIKYGRKKLRKEMRDRGIRSKQEFEITAASMGLYFDKFALLPLWWLKGKGLWLLLGGSLLLITAASLLSMISQLRGHFTINMSDGLFREGFSLSDSSGFENPTSALFAIPAVDVPCVSITWLEDDLDTAYEGEHNQDYFAYTYFLRNEGESMVDYKWRISLNSESKSLSDAIWVMVFEDGEMAFYAKANDLGEPECLPAKGVDNVGLTHIPSMNQMIAPEEQLEVIAETASRTFYRVIPKPFKSDQIVATGEMTQVEPMEVHKYTVVIWIEGDDPNCNNDLIGGHVGMDMMFQLTGESDDPEGENHGGVVDKISEIWNGLKWW